MIDIYLQLPGFSSIHTLSISQEAITALGFSQKGDWLVVGSAALGQLLVWEWRSETYILKQQGHYHDISTLAYSPDGAYIATGADDAKVGLPVQWTAGIVSDEHLSIVPTQHIWIQIGDYGSPPIHQKADFAVPSNMFLMRRAGYGSCFELRVGVVTQIA